jgi:hypothetical protein
VCVGVTSVQKVVEKETLNLLITLQNEVYALNARKLNKGNYMISLKQS